MKNKQFISVFDRDTEELVKEVEVSVNFNVLKEVFVPCKIDDEMVMIYLINEKGSLSFAELAPLIWDFQKNIYEFGTYKI